MTDIMFDIETLGNEPKSVILEIAAVPFNRHDGTLAPPAGVFSEHIDPVDSMRYGLKMNASTVGWWLQQKKEAQEMVHQAWVHGQPIKNVMSRLTKFFYDLENENPDEEIRVWGNGSGFDINLLEDAYRAALGSKPPWGFWAARDLRTLVDLADFDKTTIPFNGTAHNAMADAIHQVKIFFACMDQLRSRS